MFKNSMKKYISLLQIVVLLITSFSFKANAEGDAVEDNNMNHFASVVHFAFDDGSTLHHPERIVNAVFSIYTGWDYATDDMCFYRITVFMHGSDGTELEYVGGLDNRYATTMDSFVRNTYILMPIDTTKLLLPLEEVSFSCTYQVEQVLELHETPSADDDRFQVLGRSDIQECPTVLRFGDPCGKYDDIDYNSWYHSGIDYVSGTGMFQGVSEQRFAPDGLMTRGMLVTVLWRKQGQPEPDIECPFSDVPAGSYYEKAITWAAQNKIVRGYDGVVFGPDDPLTREQLAAIICIFCRKDSTWSPAYTKNERVQKAEGGLWAIEREVLADYFDDADQISDYAVYGMYELVERGILRGIAPRRIAPKGYATRAQVATILQRYEYSRLHREVNIVEYYW